MQGKYWNQLWRWMWWILIINGWTVYNKASSVRDSPFRNRGALGCRIWGPGGPLEISPTDTFGFCIWKKMENFIAIGVAPTHYRKKTAKVEGNRIHLLRPGIIQIKKCEIYLLMMPINRLELYHTVVHRWTRMIAKQSRLENTQWFGYSPRCGHFLVSVDNCLLKDKWLVPLSPIATAMLLWYTELVCNGWWCFV